MSVAIRNLDLRGGYVMVLSSILSIAGIVLALAGFFVLARELLRTNRDILRYATRSGAEKTSAEAIVLTEGEGGGVFFQGGNMGEMGPAATDLSKAIASGKHWTWVGLVLTAVGALFQLAGATVGIWGVSLGS
jgi:hypothetical protein